MLRNPENSTLIEYSLKEIPIFLERKVKINYSTYLDFTKIKQNKKIVELNNFGTLKIKDIEVTPFIIDSSNHNTAMLLIKSENKSVLVTGDFRNYDGNYEKNELEEALNIIGQVDYLFVEGKAFGKYGVEYSSRKRYFRKTEKYYEVL